MFSFAHKKTTSSNSSFNKRPSMIFELKQPTYHQQIPQQRPQPPPLLTDNLPKMKWGKPIWTFFHVTAQKIKAEYFNLIIKDYLQYIVQICSVLPCPICSSHASEYLRSINFNNLKNKEDLINFFYTFHNVVNQRKGVGVLPRDKIPLYETASTVATTKQFMYAFEDKSRSMKLMADDLARIHISSKFKLWINSNIQYFDP